MELERIWMVLFASAWVAEGAEERNRQSSSRASLEERHRRARLHIKWRAESAKALLMLARRLDPAVLQSVVELES